uniref:G protein-coupled receptor n=1 Tax=Pristionchus pacificus TaxID=54126 RepID=A0A8R1YVX5_PRIPA
MGDGQKRPSRGSVGTTDDRLFIGVQGNCQITERTQHNEVLALYYYETVCERVGQELAHLKNLDSLKIWFSRVLMTMGILIFHIDVPLAPDGVTSKTVFPEFLTVISIEFYLGSQTRLIFAFILTEEFWKYCFRRHTVWSQRNVDMKNEYPHRHQHPREP